MERAKTIEKLLTRFVIERLITQYNEVARNMMRDIVQGYSYNAKSALLAICEPSEIPNILEKSIEMLENYKESKEMELVGQDGKVNFGILGETDEDKQRGIETIKNAVKAIMTNRDIMF